MRLSEDPPAGLPRICASAGVLAAWPAAASVNDSCCESVLHLVVELVALFAVVDFRLMLHVAERAVVVVRGRMRIRLELLRLGSHVFALVALQAGLFIRIIRILHVRAVAGFALEAAGDVAVGAEVGGRNGIGGHEAEEKRRSKDSSKSLHDGVSWRYGNSELQEERIHRYILLFTLLSGKILKVRR